MQLGVRHTWRSEGSKGQSTPSCVVQALRLREARLQSYRTCVGQPSEAWTQGKAFSLQALHNPLKRVFCETSAPNVGIGAQVPLSVCGMGGIAIVFYTKLGGRHLERRRSCSIITARMLTLWPGLVTASAVSKAFTLDAFWSILILLAQRKVRARILWPVRHGGRHMNQWARSGLEHLRSQGNVSTWSHHSYGGR